MKSILPLALIAASLLLYGCNPSAVYSPTVMLPSAPLVKEEGQLTLGVEMMPEARPEKVGDDIVPGGTLGIRYAFSDRLTLGGRFWADLTSNEIRGGYGAEGLFMFAGDEGSQRFALMSRAALVFNGNSTDGGGFSIAVATWLPVSEPLTLYGAIGPGIGFHDIFDLGKGWGYGLISNVGLTIRPIDPMQIALEVAGIAQYNVEEDVGSILFSPGITTSWMF